ncbi:hypothetical protein RRG08_020560 [Elysia crispata]|uniref:Uncharacterized protein n=1 Tax=Elysia crispata TaxID=231223 RepID=A0AAE1A5V9_9GAST|nr:hypothetical protein RRG08_020560 [Elysia crispata]
MWLQRLSSCYVTRSQIWNSLKACGSNGYLRVMSVEVRYAILLKHVAPTVIFPHKQQFCWLITHPVAEPLPGFCRPTMMYNAREQTERLGKA